MTTPTSHLLISQLDQAIQDRIGQALESSGAEVKLRSATGQEQLIAALQGDPIDLLLLGDGDADLPLEAVVDLLHKHGRDIPVLLIAEQYDPQGALDAVKAGAADLLDLESLPRLAPAILRELHQVRNRAGLRQDASLQITRDRRLQALIFQSDRQASMGMLAAGVVHEINNPLAYILYNLEGLCDDLPILLEALDDCREALSRRAGREEANRALGDAAELLDPEMREELLESAREALSGAYRIKDTTFGMGTFSRFEDDEMAPVEIKYPIECAHTLAFNELKYRARLVKELNKVPTIMASEGGLSQVFLNLLVNAAHSIDEGNVANNEIRVRCWAAAGWIHAEVKDTGKGIPPDEMEHIFEPFYSTHPDGNGTGMGLPICRDIVEGYGGRIQVESEVGVGTRVKVSFPMASTATDHPAVLTDGQAQPGHRGRVLVVDDEAPIRTVLKRMLGREHEVVAVASGEEGMALLAEDTSYDLLLCDMMMPRTSGVDLHRWLVERAPELARRTVFITGGTFTPKCREYLESVENLKIEKPFDTKILKKIVADMVSLARA